MRRRKKQYFKRTLDSPPDLTVRLKRRVQFNEVDIMGIVWFGRYPVYFEEGSAALGRRCGLSYIDFKKANLRAPAVQTQIDYCSPLYLDEEFVIEARMVWTDAAKINTEYTLIKDDGAIATTGALTQLLIDSEGKTCLVMPKLLQKSRLRWKKGEFDWKD